MNYLDDYLFVAALKRFCDDQLRRFLEMCKHINFPVALEKTVWDTTLLIFLVLLLDTTNQTVCIPMEKVVKTLNLIDYFLLKKNRKATILQFQQLCGSLNFLCKCVVPGRAFLRQLANINNLKS